MTIHSQTQHCCCKSVALQVVKKIRENGGRFLKKHGINRKGEVLYVEIGLEKAQEKTSQALREGAPELRRQKANAATCGSTAALKSSSAFECASNATSDVQQDKTESTASRVLISTSSFDETETKNSGVLAIQPSMIMLGQRHCRPISLPVDQLEPSEREIYMNHFLPPNSALKANHRRLCVHTVSTSTQHGTMLPMEAWDQGSHECQKRMIEQTAPGISKWPSTSVEV